MRSALTILAAAAAAGLLASPLAAVPIDYDCDTPGGSYSKLDLVQPGPDYRVTGRISAVKWRTHGRWYPTAVVALISASEREAVSVRIERPGESGVLLVESLIGGKSNKVAVGSLRLKEEVAFELSVHGGKAMVQVGGKSFPLEAEISPGAKLLISCSTGQFLFKALDWDPS